MIKPIQTGCGRRRRTRGHTSKTFAGNKLQELYRPCALLEPSLFLYPAPPFKRKGKETKGENLGKKV